MNHQLPICRAEVYLPDVDDPRIVEAATNKFRFDWDRSNFAKYERLEYHCNNNSEVNIVQSANHFLLSSREFVDHRIFFTLKTAIADLQDHEKAIEV